MLVVPHFENEADEADWWFNNQELVEAEFERVKPAIGPSGATQYLRDIREKSASEAKLEPKPFAGYQRSA